MGHKIFYEKLLKKTLNNALKPPKKNKSKMGGKAKKKAPTGKAKKKAPAGKGTMKIRYV